MKSPSGILIAVAATLLFLRCEESLPPRIDPRTIDAKDFLELSSGATSGTVLFERSDSTSSSNAGNLSLSVKNLHDEVLSGREQISIDVDYWLPDFPIAETTRVHGDRDHLLNPYNFQGNVFMLDGDILTIHPDSTARFLIIWDHTEERFWDFGNPVLVVDPCGFPPCDERVITDPLRVMARASIRLFEQQIVPLVTDPIEFEITYFFIVSHSASAMLDAIYAAVDSNGAVGVHWVTSFESETILGWQAEKAASLNQGFRSITNGLLRPECKDDYTRVRGFPTVHVHHLAFDTSREPGVWFYRAVIWEDLFIVGPLAVEFLGTVRVVVP